MTASPLPPPSPRPAAGASGRSLIRGILGLLPFLAGGAAVGAGTAYFGLEWMPDIGVWAIVAFFISMWPNLVLHEAGHAVAGVARGMDLVAFGIGPLRLERGSQGHWRMRNGGGVRGMAGFAAMFPRVGREPGRLDQALVLAGGPLANLATAALVLWLAGLPAATPWASGMATGFGLSALVLGVGNLLPINSDGWRSDGMGLLDLVRDSPHAALQQQVNQMVALSVAGVRPRLWPAALVPNTTPEGSNLLLAASADSLRLNHAMDSGDARSAARAAEDLARRYADLPEAIQPAIAVSLAGYAALITRDVRQLRAWRAHCGGRSLLDLTPYLNWLDAELAMLEGNLVAAKTGVDEARDSLSLVHDAAGALMLDEYLHALEQRLLDANACPSAGTAAG